jgi:hypothetical protein
MTKPSKKTALPSTLGQLGDFLGLPAGAPEDDGAEIGCRVVITAAWASCKTGTVSDLRTSYVRIFDDAEAGDKIVMLDCGSYIMLRDLKGQFEIVGATPHTSLAAHVRAMRGVL